jgi:hypothetical protein
MTRSKLTQAIALACFAAGAVPGIALAQGCEPIRFTVPVSLGGEGEAYQPGREWRATIAYRHLLSNEWFIGTEQNDAAAPGGSSPIFDIHTALFDLAYSFNDRVRARVSIPFSKGALTRTWADGEEHTQDASGIGDIAIQGEAWLFDPLTHERGNIAIGLGIKLPTGSYKKPSQFYLGSGPVDFPADQTIQPGDGGFALLTQVQAFQQLNERTAIFAFGSYMISPKDSTDVRGAPAPAQNSNLNWSVPDVYSVRAGVAYNLLPESGLTVSLAGRLDGIPRRDLVGGGDATTIKRTSRILFAEPGLSYTRRKDTFTLSVPWRLKVNRMKSLYEEENAALNAGGFAKYLVFASYSRRL